MIADFTSYITYIELFVLLAIDCFILWLIISIYKKQWVPICLVSCLVILTIVSYIFVWEFARVMSFIALITAVIILLMLQPGEVLKKISNPFNLKRLRISKVYDRESLYDIVETTVLYLCRHKIGAILTFEGKVNLDAVAKKNGTLLNCPISPEIIETIFYPGTRLHDGAVIIRGTQIIAASVYYQPTQKPLVGKYGSRHRAAIGISEASDAVTVVISEETGRISIAYKGELEPVTTDNFKRIFSVYMGEASKEIVDEKE